MQNIWVTSRNVYLNRNQALPALELAAFQAFDTNLVNRVRTFIVQIVFNVFVKSSFVPGRNVTKDTFELREVLKEKSGFKIIRWIT
jgi:hypothetical protein